MGIPIVRIEGKVLELRPLEGAHAAEIYRKKRRTIMLDLPLEYALIKFKGNKLSGKIVPELLDLADKGIVRFVDIVFIQKEKDGNTRTVELNDLEQDAYEMFVPIGNHVSSLFTEQDLQVAAGKLPRNSAAALLLWENLWTSNLRKAILDAGGSLVERGQIAPEVVQEFKKELAAEKKKKPAAKKTATAKKKPAAKKTAAAKK
jgi:hypothetical protein